MAYCTTDLGKRVLKYESTHTVKETSEAFRVSVRAIFEWKKKWRETGNLERVLLNRKFRKPHPEKLVKSVEHPDGKVLRKLKITVKKTRVSKERDEKKHADYERAISVYKKEEPLKREIEDPGCFGPRKRANYLSFCRLNGKIRARLTPPKTLFLGAIVRDNRAIWGPNPHPFGLEKVAEMGRGCRRQSPGRSVDFHGCDSGVRAVPSLPC
jgi:transposase